MSSEKMKPGDVYLVISGTNREGSYTEKVARMYIDLLKKRGIVAGFLTLKKLDLLTRSEQMKHIEEKYLKPANKFIFIIPEYNASYPGILKLLFDNSDVQKIWFYKKALLTGVATGRAGNIRGMDHFTDVLQYLRMTVHYNKLPISRIHKLMDEKGHLDEATMKAIENQVEEFITF